MARILRSCIGVLDDRSTERRQVSFLARHPAVARTLHRVRSAGVALVGFTVLALGLAFVVLPGPAIILIPVGLAILARQYLWARTLLEPIQHLAKQLQRRAARIFGRNEPGA